MTVHEAKSGDVYVDATGKLWRCIATCTEPTVTFEEVEGRTPEPVSHLNAQVALMQTYPVIPRRVPILKDRQSGGVRGLMWEGWKRIWRPE